MSKDILNEIYILRQALHEAIRLSKNLTDSGIIKISQDLDKILSDYYNKTIDEDYRNCSIDNT